MSEGKNPIMVLSVEALTELIQKEGSVQAMMRLACKNFTPNNIRKFVLELAKKSDGLECIPESAIVIQVSGKDRRKKAQVLKQVSGVPKYYVEQLNDVLFEARVSKDLPFKHDRAFVKKLIAGTAAYGDLISLWNLAEEAWKSIGATRFAKNRGEFYKLYVWILTPLLRNKRKFSVKSYLDANVQTESGSLLNEYYRVVRDSHRDYTDTMIVEFMRVTERVTNIFSNTIKYRYKFLVAFEMLIEARSEAKYPSPEASAKYISLWIEAQTQAYNSNFSGDRNIDIELGYLCGPGAKDRYIEYKDKVKREVKNQKRSIPKLDQF